MTSDESQQNGEEARKAEPWANCAARLEAKFGVGDDPVLRRELYHRCERCCVAFGLPAYRVVAHVVSLAVRKDQPGRYFSKVVVQRLTEMGLWESNGYESTF